ncbi:hypothetical protein GPALN_007971 [Globodera pallida]|nr:hypothetical protein GPALN_007971 [Globodera pallida]
METTRTFQVGPLQWGRRRIDKKSPLSSAIFAVFFHPKFLNFFIYTTHFAAVAELTSQYRQKTATTAGLGVWSSVVQMFLVIAMAEKRMGAGRDRR